ncbi:uncharacterized protein LOC126576609 [Anopheles aquasalis]|uniref:uncharacterized protein LOC126576609 n=1 Tax=Anopheles aquasalis TaxID=42839 RepID=UPI00215AE7CF|nr:uncharacterized protein LOC126576609 [Anopheles aquasalis]
MVARTEWLNVSIKFHSKWGFPHALGAIDGKHVAINPSTNRVFNQRHSRARQCLESPFGSLLGITFEGEAGHGSPTRAHADTLA